MKKGVRKAVSVLLSAALMITGPGTAAYAAGEGDVSEIGICEHHPEHTDTCGYQPARPEQPCRHQHTDACWRYEETASPPNADHAETATPPKASPGETQKVLDCPHEKGMHDDTCGYMPAQPERQCQYVCEECGVITFMGADGTERREKVGRENIRRVVSSDYIWNGDAEGTVWYYLGSTQTFSKRIEILSGDVNLVLGSGATLNAEYGIYVEEGASLTVYGQRMSDGRLVAYGRSTSTAAIGGGGTGGKSGTAGAITINSGAVYADASYGKGVTTDITSTVSAGIGTGTGGNGSSVTINGGDVTTIGNGGGPGIGGGSGSVITITGGTVRANGGKADNGTNLGRATFGGAGIGSAARSSGGEVTITGGAVTAAGGYGAAGIGCGTGASGWSVHISGSGTVIRAEGSDGAAGIGAGRSGGAGSITVGGGAKITARGDRAAIDADLSFDGVYGGDYMVVGNEQNEEGGVVAELRVGSDQRSLGTPKTVYRYLKAEPATLKSVKISPQSASVNVGKQVSFAVVTADGTSPAADASEILKTSWSLSSGIAGYRPVKNTSLTGGLLSVGGDEQLEKLTVSAGCALPPGVTMLQDTANVTVNQTKYRVSFDANGGRTDAAPMFTTMGRLTGELPSATRTGYTFTGWYRNRPADGTEADASARVSANTVYTQDTTLYAGWRVNLYTVTYYTMGGNPASFTRTVAYGGRVPVPATPVKDLAAFEGWYTDPGYTRRWDFERGIVTGDMELYAKWSDAVLDVTVSAEAVPADGGRVLYAGKYRSGSLVTLEAEPAAGYRFLNWMKDGEVVSTSARYQLTVDEDTELKAVFTWVGIPGTSTGGGSGSGGSGFGGGSGSGGSGFGGGSGSGSSGFGGGSGSGSSGFGGGSGSGGGSFGGGSGSAGSVQGGPAAMAPAPTVIPGSGSAISTVVAIADASSVNVANAQSVSGAWVQNEQGWTLQVDGKAAANSWVCVAEKDGAHWYHFGNTGLMDTGWLELDGRRYYLYANHDGTAGRMLTGWQLLDGKWYYFSSASDATLGSLLTDTVTPDGYRVNAQGEWIQ